MSIKFSEAFMEKIFLSKFKKVSGESFFRSYVRWMIDSKYRTYKRMDLFLKDQIEYIYRQVDNHNKGLAYDANAVQAFNISQELRHSSKDPDDLIVKINNYILKTVKYKTDDANFERDEYWADMLTTLNKKFDDCDGMNGAVYVMARLAGIHPINLYCVLGNTVAGYHFWTLYYSPGLDRVVSVDTTFYPNTKSVSQRGVFKISDGGYSSVDYIFNEEVIWKIN